jgi:hypothetical protein
MKALLPNDVDVGLVKFEIVFDPLANWSQEISLTSLKAERAMSRCRFHSAPSVPTILSPYILIA